MNKKVLATIAMATIGLSSVAYVNADFSERGFNFMWKMNLTDEQITQVESMTTEEKQAFFEEIRYYYKKSWNESCKRRNGIKKRRNEISYGKI